MQINQPGAFFENKALQVRWICSADDFLKCEFSDFIPYFESSGVRIVNEPDPVDPNNLIFYTHEQIVDMNFHDNNVVFTLNIVKGDSPCLISIRINREISIGDMLSVFG